MEVILYTNVVCGNVSEVDRLLKISSSSEKVKMLKYVCHSHRIYFSLSNVGLPSGEVTSLILQNIVNVIDGSKTYWNEALHIAVRYRNYDVVRTLISKHNVMSTSMEYATSGILVEATPMDISIYSGDARMIALLLAHDISIRPHQYGTQFDDTDPIEVIKLQSAMDEDLFFSSKDDLLRAIHHGMCDRMLVFMVSLSDLLTSMNVGDALFHGHYNIARLLHIHFKQTTYSYDRTYSFDLPSLQEVSSYTLQISKIQEELTAIRGALRDLKENKMWMEIENDRILYPLIRRVIDSSTENCRVVQINE